MVYVMPAYAQMFETGRDMGPCASALHRGKNCVTITHQQPVRDMQEGRNLLGLLRKDYEALAAQKKLAVSLQYSSFAINAENDAYVLVSKYTYHLPKPDDAQTFIVTLKEQKRSSAVTNFQADILADLMKGWSCPEASAMFQ
jgi:hypothetical protein